LPNGLRKRYIYTSKKSYFLTIKTKTMAQVLAKNGRKTLPSILSNFFDTERFFPEGLMNWDAPNVFPWMGVDKVPSVNITERDKDFLIEVAAPGLEKKDFKVEVENDILSISAEKEEMKEEKENGMTRREFAYNNFCRSFRLPENSKLDKIDARYKDGILKIEIPKLEVKKAKMTKAVAVQ
jgi:HSP20 family protein